MAVGILLFWIMKGRIMKPKNGETHMRCRDCGKEHDLSTGRAKSMSDRKGWLPSRDYGDLCTEFSRVICADCSYHRYWFID